MVFAYLQYGFTTCAVYVVQVDVDKAESMFDDAVAAKAGGRNKQAMGSSGNRGSHCKPGEANLEHQL
jgi:hypothetical protein